MRNSKKFHEAFSALNSSQREAVETLEGPLLVVAGPGTGKTQTLALRLANILATTHAKPWNLLALTFTESAAINLKQRLATIIGPDAYGITACTFHAFAARLLATFPAEFVTLREAQPLDELAQLRIIQTLLDHGKFEHLRPLRAADFYTRSIAKAFSTLKREGFTPEQFQELLARETAEFEMLEHINPRTGKKFGKILEQEKQLIKNRELALVYARYQATLAERGLVDFDDLILSVVRQLTMKNEELIMKNEQLTINNEGVASRRQSKIQNPKSKIANDFLLAYLQENFLYVTVDEFQDTNGAQEAILRAYASFDRQPNLCVVGDDDQSIYRFQGANLANILDFTTNYDDVKIVTLTQNYRSTQPILDASRSLIERNSERLVNKIPGLTKVLIASKARQLDSWTAGQDEEKTRIQNTEYRIQDEENLKFKIDNLKFDSELTTKDSKTQGLKDLLPQILEFSSAEDEATYLVSAIQKLLAEEVPAHEIAVLYRNRRDGDLLATYLARAHVPVYRADGQDALTDARVIQLLHLLRALADPSDSVALFSALATDFVAIPEVDLFRLARAADRFDGILDCLADDAKFDTLALATEYRPAIQFENSAGLKAFGAKLRHWLALTHTTNLVELVETVAGESGLTRRISECEEYVSVTALAAFLNYTRQFVVARPEADLKELLADIQTMRKEKIALSLSARSSSAVTLTTAHRAKGMEWAHVFVVKCADEVWGGGVKRELIKLPDLVSNSVIDLQKEAGAKFPILNFQFSNNSQISKFKINAKISAIDEILNTKYKILNTSLEDERRLFYVAMTRAKESLTLSVARNYEFRALTPSRFLAEIDSVLIARVTPVIDEALKIELVLPGQNTEYGIQNTVSGEVEVNEELRTMNNERITTHHAPTKDSKSQRLKDSATQKFLASLVAEFRLSPTALNTYLACPRKFLLQSLLRLPDAADPEARAGAIFGSAIHAGLEAFFREFKLTEKLPAFESAFTAIQKKLAREPLTRAQRERFEKDVIRATTAWLTAQKDQLRPPLEVEFNFGKHELHLDDIPLVGKVDRIDLVPGTNDRVNFLDYKSQKPYSRNAILGLTADATGDAYRQLVFYHLLAELDTRFIYAVANVSLVFLRPDPHGEFVAESFAIESGEIEDLKKLIRETFVRIRNLEFACADDADCRKCQFAGICGK